MARREHLFGDFIEEASKLFTDALAHQLDDPSKFVRLYALVGKLRLFASANVIAKAEGLMQRIIENLQPPQSGFSQSARQAGGRRRCASGI